VDGKSRFIFPVLMAGVAVPMTAPVTWLSPGIPGAFMLRRLSAFAAACPFVALAAALAIPVARRARAFILWANER
jgi:hypothetical protein